MVTENDLPDEIAQEQQVIDQEQGITQEGLAGPTNQQLLDRMVAQDNQIRGLQGLIDKGLNSIRDDTKAWMDTQVGGLRGDLDRERFLAGLDEDTRPTIERVLQEVDRRIPTQSVASPSSQPATNGQVDQWNLVRQYVETMGLSNTDQRVQYNLLADGNNQVDANKWANFRDHLITLHIRDLNPRIASNQSPPTQQRPATANPPVEGGGQIPLGNLTKAEDIQMAFVTGRFNTEEDPNGMREFKKRMSDIGESV